MDIRATLAWFYAAAMAVLTAVAEGADAIEHDRLVWVLGFAGSLFGAAFFPSTAWWRTALKMLMGWIISGVLSAPISASHYAPEFVNLHVAALWLGFAGPALFFSTLESNNVLSRFLKGRSA